MGFRALEAEGSRFEVFCVLTRWLLLMLPFLLLLLQYTRKCETRIDVSIQSESGRPFILYVHEL